VGGFMHPHPFFGLLAVILAIIPAWKVVAKAGYNGAWSLLIFVPLVNIVMMYVFAFSEWPKERQTMP
jgi:energy-coupling factor transporter transmembrane protein EcfT